ncbi:MAG: hypothetical protein M3Q97_01440 [Bacteroidota bacterium]|nr:hypothetical protein [Bacteroidota bacterium]
MNHRQELLSLLLFVFTVFGFVSCSDDRWDIDTSEIEVNTEVVLLDKLLFNSDTNAYSAQIEELLTLYPDFGRAYIELITSRPFQRDTSLVLFTKIHLKDKYVRDSLVPDIKKRYSEEDIQLLEQRFTEAFKRFRYFYPKDSIPDIFLANTAFVFKEPLFSYKNKILVCTEMYMGAGYKYYPFFGFPQYIQRTMDKHYIVADVVKFLYETKYPPGIYGGRELLGNMIYQGKNLYFQQVMAPFLPDTIIMRYTKKQLAWAEDYEVDIWERFSNKDVLFSTDPEEVGRFLRPGPNTSALDFPTESAPRLGEWVGLQIVKSYMERHPEVSLQQLMEMKDYKKILSEARYKPK